MSAIDLVSLNSALYEKRRAVYPRAVDGMYRRLKWLVMAVTLTIYYVTPWLRWDRGPYAPDQAVLLDLEHRRFYMFGIEIWPQEFYYVAGLLVMAGIGLFLVTSAVGRAWCGYACPQTVWTDLFVHIERAIDGDRNAQVRLAKAPWTLNKLVRRLAKHSAWLLIAMVTGGAWIFYFADAPTLAGQLIDGSAPFVAWATIGILTFTTYTLGGHMREQVCIYMCPWPRIQTAMLDEKSLLVTYRDWRGEPRSHGLKKTAEASAAAVAYADIDTRIGDCIDCTACVSVCPTGIDIRDGPQIGCITCGLCIDACNQVMTRIGKPRGLIDYVTLDDAALEQGGAPARPAWRALLRPRTLVYFLVWCSIGLGMLLMLGGRNRLDLTISADRNPSYVQLSDGDVRNAFLVTVRNMETRPRTVALSVAGVSGGTLWMEGAPRRDGGMAVPVVLAPDATTRVRVYLAAPAAGERPITFTATPNDSGGDRRPVTSIASFQSPAAP